MATFLGRLWGTRADAAPAAEPPFCRNELPEMVRSFVDHVVDAAYTGAPPAPAADQGAPPPLPLRLPAAERLVAIGDLHGDITKARRAFRLAGLTDDAGNWTGGTTVCVQVGDILDRGDAELPILYFLEALQHQAAAAGGALHVLNGNHETMNVAGNYRYATAGADTEMASWATWQLLGDRLRRQCGCDSAFGDEASAHAAAAGVAAAAVAAAAHADAPGGGSGRQAAQFNPLRRASLKPGGPVSRRFFARHPTVLQVGSTLFVHGGVLPAHVEYGLERINSETQAWLMGEAPHPAGGGAPGAGAGAAAGGGQARGGGGAQAAGGGASPAAAGGWSLFGSIRRGAGLAAPPGALPGGGGRPGGAAAAAQPPAAHPPPPPGFLRGSHAIVWARDYSARDEARCDCDKLGAVLDGLPGAKRMVVGHTIQDGGITSACGGRVFRVDVGMSQGCGDGEPEVLEVLRDTVVRRLTEGGAPEVMAGAPAAAGQPHQPHHLTGPAVDTPAGGAWAEALAAVGERLRGALGGGSGGGGGAAAGGAAPKQEPTPA